MIRLRQLAKLLLSTALLLVAFIICHLILKASWNQSTPLLDQISIDCDAINSVNTNQIDNPTLAKWALWNYDRFDREMAIYATSPGKERCSLIKKWFHFPRNASSVEELNFPLAYGMVIYKNLAQFLFMFSAFYQPQNLYCIVVDRDSHALFIETIHGLSSCFDNVHVVTSNRSISWGGHEILTSMYGCAEYLAKQEHLWKYYQYLSGFDVPLKTNLEMVRIFTALKQTVNVEVVGPTHQTRNRRGELSPLRIYKASMSALVPRAAMNAVTKEHSAITTAVIRWLNVSQVPSDELLWPTIFGNMRRLPIPGGFDARLILRKKTKSQKKETKLKQRNHPIMNINVSQNVNVPTTKSNWAIAATSRDVPVRYWLGRFQIWRNAKDEEPCHGKWTHGSCVYGVGDVPHLLKRPELVAHKLYIEYQPAAFFCLLKEHQRRSMDTHNKFNASLFSSMPFVELARGVDIEHLSHPELLY